MSPRDRHPTFPCPVCKGKGFETDEVTVGEGRSYDCQWCDGGLIVIGSEQHIKVFFSSSAWDKVIFKFTKQSRDLTKSERKMIKSIKKQLRELWASLSEEEG